MDLDRFHRLLDQPTKSGKKKELVVQEYLEKEAPELIPTLDLLGHDLHLGCVISQFPLSEFLVPDFAYLTKNSIEWRVVFVELECPDKPIFKANKGQIGFRSELYEAIEQIRSWKIRLEEDKAQTLRVLDPIRQPLHMQSNPIDFHYVLVYGRSHEYDERNERKKALRHLSHDESIRFLSYDSLARLVRNGRPTKINILQINKGIYSFKFLHAPPEHILSCISPDCLQLSCDDKATLKGWGYDIDAWEQGKLLRLNHKFPIADSDSRR